MPRSLYKQGVKAPPESRKFRVFTQLGSGADTRDYCRPVGFCNPQDFKEGLFLFSNYGNPLAYIFTVKVPMFDGS